MHAILKVEQILSDDVAEVEKVTSHFALKIKLS